MCLECSPGTGKTQMLTPALELCFYHPPTRLFLHPLPPTGPAPCTSRLAGSRPDPSLFLPTLLTHDHVSVQYNMQKETMGYLPLAIKKKIKEVLWLVLYRKSDSLSNHSGLFQPYLFICVYFCRIICYYILCNAKYKKRQWNPSHN